MLGLLEKVIGTSNDRVIKRLQPVLNQVAEHEARLSTVGDWELRNQTARFKERLANGESLDDLLPEAFATVREAAKRVTGMRPFDVQIIGGTVLHQGNIAEMVTGEGKTLVATMPLYLNALTGRGVHLVTVNDYLARRDSQWMGPIFQFLGMTVGLIQQGMAPPERQVAYRADITYGTNNEFGFDYLRDNMAVRPEMRVQRELNYAIIDEVDSILVDEARTPLIISGRPEKSTDLYYKVDDAVRKLRKETHYEIEEKGRHVMLTEEGMEYAEKLLSVENLYTDDSLGIVHMIEQSIRAHEFYKKDDEYVVVEGQVQIVDEFTGRIMEGRRYSDGLHQAIEAKEKVHVQFESQTVASITYQNLFKMYNKIAGMTGTALTEAAEFGMIYNLDVVQIPTNLPLIRDDQTDLVFSTEEGKFKYVVEEIKQIHETNRPILVGTVNIEKSERLADMLQKAGVENVEVLNAKHHEREAAIVANAGKPGAITIATNMAGRGTDIKLGEGVRELGGLAIVGTERHDSRRIDNQLRGRCGRQGDPGTTRFFLSLEDEVARLFGGDRVKRLISAFGGEQMDETPLDQRMVTRSIERAQKNVEEYNFEVRKHLLEYDGVMNRQRQVVYKMRRDVLEDRDITEQLHDMIASIVEDAVDTYAPENVEPEEWDIEGLETRFKFIFGWVPDMSGESSDEAKKIEDDLYDQVIGEYRRREQVLADTIRADFHEQMKGQGNGSADESKVNFAKIARKRIHDLEKMVLLRTVDDKWIEHLYTMDYLRESVRLRAYGQKDPLIEYKTEGFELFEQFMMNVFETVIQTLFRMTDPEGPAMARRPRTSQQAAAAPAAKTFQPEDDMGQYTYVSADKQADQSFATYDTGRFTLSGQGADGGDGEQQAAAKAKARPKTVRRVGEKIKPNDPCPCGSGKKYKKCCGSA